MWGFLLSVFDSRGTVKLTAFVGFENYQAMLTNPEFIKSLGTVVMFAIFIVPTTFALSLFLAVLVQNAPFGKGFFRTVFFIPTAISYVIASMIWRMSIFSGVPSGLANQVIWGLFEHDSITWIGTPSPPWYWLVLVTVRLWLQVGFYMIVFIAGMQAIPPDLYEAAQVDGAKEQVDSLLEDCLPLASQYLDLCPVDQHHPRLQRLRRVFQHPGGTYAAGSGGLLSMARPPLVYLYQVAMAQQDYGRGTAGAFILAVIIIGATLLQNRIAGGFGQGEY